MLVDLTLPIGEEMKLFPDLEGPTFERTVAGETDAVTHRICTSTHQGTHIDAPAHYIPDGETIDEVPAELLIGRANVVDLRNHRGELITAETLASSGSAISAHDRVLLLTGDVDERFGDADFFDDAAALTPGAAEWLVESGVSLIANDFLTERLADPERPVHKTLLGGGIPIVEYLCNADHVASYETVELIALPLALSGLDGSPARVIARTDD